MFFAWFSLFETWVAVSANVFDLAMRPMTSCVNRATCVDRVTRERDVAPVTAGGSAA